MKCQPDDSVGGACGVRFASKGEQKQALLAAGPATVQFVSLTDLHLYMFDFVFLLFSCDSQKKIVQQSKRTPSSVQHTKITARREQDLFILVTIIEDNEALLLSVETQVIIGSGNPQKGPRHPPPPAKSAGIRPPRDARVRVNPPILPLSPTPAPLPLPSNYCPSYSTKVPPAAENYALPFCCQHCSLK